MPPEPLFDPSHFDFAHVVADQAAIRRVNPQRHEMEHLNAILHVDREQQLCIGYKDVRGDEFWVRGHLPGYPLLPGVLMCEAAAQLCSYYIATQRIMESEFIGFGGMENVRFRSPVRPGDRLVLVSKGIRIRQRQAIFNVQGFVGTTMVFQADIIGVPLPRPAGMTVDAGEA